MDRREFLKTSGGAAAVASTATAVAAQTNPATEPVAAPAVAKGLRELRVAMPWPDATFGLADQAHRLAQRITTMSDGRYRIAFQGGVANGLEAVRAGEADLYFASEHDHLDAHRALSYFAGLPGDRAIAPHHLAGWMLIGGGQTLWDDFAGNLGIKAMLAGHAGNRACFLATRRISTMSELTGERAAVQGLARDVARGLGMTPVAIGAAQLPAALASGDILAAEWGGAITSHALGIMSVAPFAVGASINKHGSALSLGMSRTAWDRLGATDQAIFAAAAATEYQTALAEEDSHRRLLYPEPPLEKVWSLATELERAIRRVAGAVVAHVAASDADAQRINAGFMGFRTAMLGASAETPSV